MARRKQAYRTCDNTLWENVQLLRMSHPASQGIAERENARAGIIPSTTALLPNRYDG